VLVLNAPPPRFIQLLKEVGLYTDATHRKKLKKAKFKTKVRRCRLILSILC